MFLPFFLQLKVAKVPVTLREYLTLLEAMDKNLVQFDVEGFYYLARSALVKDERHLDRYDQVFAHVFKGLEAVSGAPDAAQVRELPEEWLKKLAEKHLSDEEKALVESLGGWDKLMETLKKRLEEQHKRHQGGSKMIGTAGTSPFGAYGYNPEGVRIGQQESRHRRAVKVW
ncbi:MAG: VWA domain-containing protein, partial [Nitratireductor sp.]|nr:VWA domain-containing protein [Nitratireductor sp.]